MGRLVVGTGEEVGGKACFFIVFSTFLVALGKKNHPKSLKTPNWRKNCKNIKNMTKTRPPSFGSWGSKNDKNVVFLQPQKSLKKSTSQNSDFGGHFPDFLDLGHEF